MLSVEDRIAVMANGCQIHSHRMQQSKDPDRIDLMLDEGWERAAEALLDWLLRTFGPR